MFAPVRAGSSPRVRGRLESFVPEVAVDGLIPACAGQTSIEERREFADAAHPRVCRADLVRVMDAANVKGSSPRVRGRPVAAAPAVNV